MYLALDPVWFIIWYMWALRKWYLGFIWRVYSFLFRLLSKLIKFSFWLCSIKTFNNAPLGLSLCI